MHKSRRTELRATQAVGLAVLLTAFHAGADVHYVDRNSTNPVPPFTNWSTAAKLIQEGANAADSGDTVRIAAGDYYEQVVLAFKNNVTLVGEPGVVIHATDSMLETLRSYGWLYYPVLGIYRSDVVLSGITVDGAHVADRYTNIVIGMYFLGSGGQVTNCTIKGFRPYSLTDFADADGLQCYNPVQAGSPAVNLGVYNSNFEDNESALLLRGDPLWDPGSLRISINIVSNTVTGLGPLPISHFGIWIVNGVSGNIVANKISGWAYTGTNQLFSAGIAAFDGRALVRKPPAYVPLLPLQFEGNALSSNHQHLVILAGNGSKVVNNTFTGSGANPPRWGALSVCGTNMVVADNDFADLPTGMILFGGGEPFNSGWPPLPGTCSPTLTANWFSSVAEPLRLDRTMVCGIQEQGTETSYPFAPRFRSFTKSSAGEARALLRGWHGDTVMLQASTNLVDWVPVHTHIMELPTHECRDMNTDGAAQEFYRARRL